MSPVAKLYENEKFILAVVVAISLLIAIGRYLMLGGYVTATSNDAGTWLAYARIVLGNSQLSSHVNSVPPFGSFPLYNLLAPWVPVLPLAFLVSTLGYLTGLKVFMVLVSVAPVLPGYFAFRMSGVGRFVSIVASVVLISIPTYATMFAWANYDGMLGLAFALASIGFTIAYLEQPRRHLLVGLAASIGLTAGSDSVFFSMLVVAYGLLLAFLLASRMWPEVRNLLFGAAAGMLASLPFLPVYLDVMVSRSPGSSQVYPPTKVLAQLFYSYHVLIPTPVFLLGAVALVTLTLYLWRHRPPTLVSYMIASLFVASFVLAFTLLSYRPVRFWYLVGVPLAMLVTAAFGKIWDHSRSGDGVTPVMSSRTGYWAFRLTRGRRRILGVAILLILSAAIVSGSYVTASAYTFYQDLNPQTLAALGWISRNTPTSAVFLSSASGLRSPHFDFWIKGLGDRQAFGEAVAFVPDVPDLTFKGESVDASLVSLALRGDLLLTNGMLLLADSFPFGAPMRPLVGSYVGSYQNVVGLNWSSIALATADPTNQTYREVPLASLQQSQYTSKNNLSRSEVSYSYLGKVPTSLDVNVTEALIYGSRTAQVTLSVATAKDSPFELIGASGAWAFLAPTATVKLGLNTSSFLFQDMFGRWSSGVINASASSGSVDFLYTGPRQAAGERFLLNTGRPCHSLSVEFKINLQGVYHLEPPSFRTFRMICQQLNCSYVLVFADKTMERAFVRSLGAVAYQNSVVTIYDIKPVNK